MRARSITTHFGNDHERLDGLLRRLAAKLRRDPTAADRLFREFKVGLERHIRCEEEILFPIFEAKTGLQDGGPTEVMRHEHRQILGLLNEIHGNLAGRDPSLEEAIGVLQGLLAAHNHKEEYILYPAIDRSLSASECDDVFAAMQGPKMIRIHHLFVSPGHNFFGHHGGPPGNHPVIEVEQIECVVGRGIRGDRFFDFKEDYKGQITFFSLEVFEALRRELNLPDAQPAATRRNVFVSGVDLNKLVGREFKLQGIRFAGVEECRPCYWMDKAFGPGAEAWLNGQGGLRCRILSNGWLRRSIS